MIKSLYQINSALTSLSQQLSSTQSSNQTIRRCINNLVQEVRFLDDKEKYHYYLLVAEIYATRFQNIQQAQKQLQQFSNTLNSEISMNCELTIAFFKYFQQNYKQAYKHLDLGLGEVEQQLKLIDNAKFFFNRVLNKQYLISQSKQKSNFEAGFILSLIYQYEKEQIMALKQLQVYVDQSSQNFRKFQIYKRLLQLYESMKRNSISTISISKKSLQTYREDLSVLQNKYPQFEQNYQFKCRFINRIIDFTKTQENLNKDKLMKKMLDFKLLAYYKLKKCSKQAPSKQIKMTLQNTAKLIKVSKQTQLLESILNYDFIKKQYEVFKVFYKPTIMKKLVNIKLFNTLCNYHPGINAMRQKSLASTIKQKQIAFQEEDNIFTTKAPSINEQPLYTFKPNSILKSPPPYPNQSQIQSQVQSQYAASQSVVKSKAPVPIKETQSQLLMQDFEGSKMYKIHATSQGYEQRYFYIRPQSVKEKPRLYYCISKKQKGNNDSYYSLKGLDRIQVGKNSAAFRRKDTAKFSQSQCFALLFSNEKDRCFYVPNENDFQRWIVLLQTKVLYTQANIEKMSHTVGYSKKQGNKQGMNRTSPPMKKSRKVIDI